jgi:phage/plasmid-like protein (TIGR03299 family)
MAHGLEIVNGKASMAYANEVPWHGLGTQVADDLTAQEMMVAAGADWRVNEVETYAIVGDQHIPTGMKALLRETDNKVLTQVGKNWHPVQNEDAFDFFKQFVDEGHMTMETAGVLNDGRNVWAMAKIKGSAFDVFGGDVTEGNLLFSNPHEYGKTIDIRFCATRVVCKNTLAIALNGGSKNFVKVNHRKAFDAEAVKETMGIAGTKMDRYKQMAEYLGSKQTTKETLMEYFGELMGKSEKKEGRLTRNGEIAMELIDTQPGAEFAEGSWWQAFNTVTYMTNHVIGRSADSRMQSTWYGANQSLNSKALEVALDFAEKA